jgi:hypothetical protein
LEKNGRRSGRETDLRSGDGFRFVFGEDLGWRVVRCREQGFFDGGGTVG